VTGTLGSVTARPVRRFLLGSIALGLALAFAGAAFTIAPGLVWPDAAAPASVARHLDAARQRVRMGFDGLRFVHLRLVATRCRDDGGVAVVFEQVEFPFLSNRFAIVMSPNPEELRSGHLGVGLVDPTGHPEFTTWLGDREVSCT
jgi:hypothetical protein